MYIREVKGKGRTAKVRPGAQKQRAAHATAGLTHGLRVFELEACGDGPGESIADVSEEELLPGFGE
jgi:hypothetical protein